MPRPGEPPLGAGESSSVPGTAAIANAIFDATGVRFRAAAVHARGGARGAEPAAGAAARRRRGRSPARRRAPCAPPIRTLAARERPAGPAAGALAAGGVGVVARPAGLAPGDRAGAAQRAADLHRRDHRARPPARRARRLRRLPHRAGRRAATPAGARWRRRSAPCYSTNLTPDAETGIGRWSLQRLPARDARRHLARRPSPVPGLPVHRVRARPATTTCRRSTPT